MCDVGGKGSEKDRDVTHVTSAAGLGQEVVDGSASPLYTALHGTARMTQATENDESLPQSVSQPTAPDTDGRAPSNVSYHTKICIVFGTHRPYRTVSYTADCEEGGVVVCAVIFKGAVEQRDET